MSRLGHWPHRRHRPPPGTRTDADTIQALLTERADLLAQVQRLRAWEGTAKRMVAAVAGGPYSLGTWANELVHADPCDCDLDEENAGPECIANSDWRWAVLADGGAFAPRPVVLLPRRPPPQPEADDWRPPELPGLDELTELEARASRAEAQLALARRFLTLDGLDQYLRAVDHLDDWRPPDPEEVRATASTAVDGPRWRAPGW